MKKVLLTIRDDVCAANGKDVAAAELLEKMKLWGDVEDYENAIASVRAEYESTIGGLNTQLAAIKEQELTDDEIALLNSYRSCKKATGDKYQARIDALELQLESTKADYLKKAEQISALLIQ